MSTMEPIPTDYVEQELDDNEQCSVSQTINILNNCLTY